jgi:hypothetical protein
MDVKVLALKDVKGKIRLSRKAVLVDRAKGVDDKEPVAAIKVQNFSDSSDADAPSGPDGPEE